MPPASTCSRERRSDERRASRQARRRHRRRDGHRRRHRARAGRRGSARDAGRPQPATPAGACRGDFGRWPRPGLRRRRHRRGQRERCVRRGHEPLRPGRHSGQQRGRRPQRALHAHRPRVVAGHAGGQPHWRLSVLPRRPALYAGAQRGPHRQHRQHRGPHRLRLYLRLLRRQARCHRADALARAGDGAHRHHRERRLPRLHRDRDAAAHAGQYREQDRPQRGRGARRDRQAFAAGAAHLAAGSGKLGAMAVPAGIRSDHRPGHRRRRRRSPQLNGGARMSEATHLAWPFLDDGHRRLARELGQWTATHVAEEHDADTDRACKELVAALGKAGWLRYCVAQPYGGAHERIDVRSLCILRETLARHSGLADFSFAMQGLGSGALSIAGSDAQKRKYLPGVAAGTLIAAFALSEPEAGSDVAALAATARRDGDHYVLDGEKTWISNGGIADFYCVFVRTGEAPGSRGISAFVVDADTSGLDIAERIPVMAPHPLATLRFTNCRVPAETMLGRPGGRFKVAMPTLDIFRTSVAAAALGFARRALHEALSRATGRRMFGQTLADFQLTQAVLADMATAIDTSALLTYRAAWARDCQGARATREVAMAKMVSTEAAQQVIDKAMQIFGGLGVKSGMTVERLYREIRPLRIYEGATEVQKLIIAREVLKEFA